MEQGTPKDHAADPSAAVPGARRRTIGALLVFIGTLLALTGTGLAASSSFTDVARADVLVTGLAGGDVPFQFLIGAIAALAGAAVLFFGLVLRELGARRALAAPADLTVPSVRFERVDPVHERHVRWGVMGALVAVFVMSIFAAVALSPDPLVPIGAAEEDEERPVPLYQGLWEGEAATSPTAHLERRLAEGAGRTWLVPDGSDRAFVNVSWEPVDADASSLRVVLQVAEGDTWVDLERAEGTSPITFNSDVEEDMRLRAVVERVTPSDDAQPFLLYMAFWSG